MGETIPFQLWGFDSRWKIWHANERMLTLPPLEYLKRNLWIITSGFCSDEPPHSAVGALGESRIVFSVDHRFEQTHLAADWIENSDIPAETRQKKTCSGNAEALLGLQ